MTRLLTNLLSADKRYRYCWDISLVTSPTNTLENFKAQQVIFAVMRGTNPQPTNEGSSPSPGAYRRLVLIASNDNISAKDRISAEASACEVALAITKLAFEGPIILKGFSAYFCGDNDDLAQLELKNQAASAL